MKIWRRKSVRVAGIIVIVLAIVAIGTIFWLRSQSPTKAFLKIIPDNVDIQVKNVVYTDVGAEGTKWEVRADLATYQKNEKKVLLDKVNAKLVLSDGKTYTMTGDKGAFGTETKNMDIWGHVTILSDQRDRIEMNELHYTDKDKTFRTDSTVTQENDRMRLTGKGMILSLITRELRLLSAVKALIRPN
ncbi:MAG: Lipopolysaccharide export system protein LptC [Syntrophus sp. SKADARSKE-3]|nr:Lipopolysaccharide export system protein LptC [Syntrophus sp. SKADARSKE-3]